MVDKEADMELDEEMDEEVYEEVAKVGWLRVGSWALNELMR